MTNHRFLVSDSAAKRISLLIEKRNDPNVKLRISVDSGGCSGFQYQYNFVSDEISEDDLYIEKNGSKIIIDSISLRMLEGSTLNFQEDLNGAYFSITNPQAQSGCGCGNSFNPKT